MRHQNADRFSGRPARLRDVADAAGVSTATASRALTFPDRVREDTRERVMEAARRLGYTPNEAARTLRAGASRMVLALLPQRCSEVFFAGVLAGIDQELSSHGYTMIMGSLEGNDVRARRLSDLVFAHHLDGVIVLTPVIPRLDGRSILEAGIPVVSVCAEIGGEALQTVVIDDEGCAAEQTDHLIGLGHRRLLYVAGLEGNYNEVHRYRGFRRAAAAAGIGEADLLRLPGDYSLVSGAAAAQTVLSMKTRPTGVVCASDEMAIGFIKTLSANGVKCPSEISVVGFDDIEFASFSEPTLTTIRQPREDLGATGARALLAALRAEAPPRERKVVLPAPLVIRGSTAKAPTARRQTRREPVGACEPVALVSAGSATVGAFRA